MDFDFDSSNVAKKAIAEELQEDGIDPSIAGIVAGLIVGSDDDSSVDSGQSKSKKVDTTSDETPKQYKSRRTFDRRKQEDSNWFKRYLTPEAKRLIINDRTSY